MKIIFPTTSEIIKKSEKKNISKMPVMNYNFHKFLGPVKSKLL